MNILFFTSFNSRSLNIESYIQYFHAKGHRVFLLTTVEKGLLHQAASPYAEMCVGVDLSGMSIWKRVVYLKRFVQKHQIEVVNSHLQQANIIAVLTRQLKAFRLFTVRHNSDVMYLSGSKKEQLVEKVINTLSPNIIAISKKVKEVLIERENVAERKIHLINNGYHFEQYTELYDEVSFQALKEQFANRFLLLSPGRLIKIKRFHQLITTVERLKEQIPTIHLIILGRGEEESTIRHLIREKALEKFVTLMPFTQYISNYYSLANITIQVSESEASNNVVKEALYFDNPVIACDGVGDFSDYLQKEFLISQSFELEELNNKILEIYNHPAEFKKRAVENKEVMLSLFSIEAVGEKLEKLFCGEDDVR